MRVDREEELEEGRGRVGVDMMRERGKERGRLER
jgi:hypothetical protein